MLNVPEHRRWLVREQRRNLEVLGEHRRALGEERSRQRTHRRHLADEGRQHARILAEIREGLARERRYYRDAMAANKWLLALVDAIFKRQQARAALGRTSRRAA